jgi:hypothetical protein
MHEIGGHPLALSWEQHLLQYNPNPQKPMRKNPRYDNANHVSCNKLGGGDTSFTNMMTAS